MPELQSQIGSLWWQISQQVHERLRQAFRGTDRPGVSLIFLREIGREPGLTVSDLARKTGMVKSHVSRTIDQLCQEGYVEKRSDPSDQRLIRLHITQSAAELRAEMEVRVQSAWAEVLAEISTDERAVVLHGLRVLLEALKRSSAGPGESRSWCDLAPTDE